MIKFNAFVFMRNNFFMFNIRNIELIKQPCLRNSNVYCCCFFQFHFMILLVNLVNNKVLRKNFKMNFRL